MDINVQSLIDGLDGVCYLVQPAGAIAAVGQPNWQRFAEANGADGLEGGDDLIGRSLFDFIDGDSVRATYRRAFASLVDGTCRKVSLDYQCDSPTVTRHHRLSITPLGNGTVHHLLLQNITVAECPRPALGLFDFAVINRHALDKSLPILAMCSYCQTVRFPADSTDETGEWVAAETYYRRGGTGAVRISHGMCPDCFDEMDLALDEEAYSGRLVANLARPSDNHASL